MKKYVWGKKYFKKIKIIWQMKNNILKNAIKYSNEKPGERGRFQFISDPQADSSKGSKHTNLNLIRFCPSLWNS